MQVELVRVNLDGYSGPVVLVESRDCEPKSTARVLESDAAAIGGVDSIATLRVTELSLISSSMSPRRTPS